MSCFLNVFNSFGEFSVNIEDNSKTDRRKKEAETNANNQGNNQTGPNGVKRATDDYHYDKFRKQFRRY